MKKMFFILTAVTLGIFSIGVSQHIAQAASASCPALASGDMIKVTGKPAIYVLDTSLKTLYFPDGDVYKSWRPTYGGYKSITQECYDSLDTPTTYPGGTNYRPGTYIVKRPSSAQLYAVEPKNTLAIITSANAQLLYGANYEVKTIDDKFWPNYVSRGTDTEYGKPHPGMVISINNKYYYIDEGGIYREITSAGLAANGFQTKFIRYMTASALTGLSAGTTITAAAPALTDITQKTSGSAGASIPAASETTPSSPIADVPHSGTTYYVATNGSNSNAGTADKPWATPGYGSRQLHAGDTLIIKGGTYNLTQYDDDIIMPPSGNATNYVVIRGESGNRPILKGGDNLLTAIDLGGKNYVKISNIELTNNGHFRDGLEIMSAPASHIVLENLYFHHLDEYGMNIADVNDLKIINSIISYCGYGSLGGPAGEQGGWRNVLISGTTMSYSGHYYQGGPGPSAYDRPDGFGIEASAGPIEIAGSIAEHNYGDGIDSKAGNTNVHDTIIRNNSCDGLKLWGTGSKATNVLIYGRGDGKSGNTPWSDIVLQTDAGATSANFTLDKVTVDDYQGGNYLFYAQYDNPHTPTTVTIKNSIFSSRGSGAPIYMAPDTNYTISNSAFYFPDSDSVLNHGDTSYTSSEVGQFGSGNIYGDPKFIAPAWGTNGNYGLQSGSPAVGMGYAP